VELHDGLKLVRDIKVVIIVWPIELGLWAIAQLAINERALQTVSCMVAFGVTFWLTTGLATYDTYKDNEYLQEAENELEEQIEEKEDIEIPDVMDLASTVRISSKENVDLR
jgi:hypothetical protein